MTMRFLRAENYRRMKWKNGQGETAEIAVFPRDAAIDAFGWRISMAGVVSDGPFSAFAGIDRSLSLLEGEGMVLDIEGREPATLTTASTPHDFPADAPTSARLVGGPITDLNVMTRRGHFRHDVTRCRLDGALALPGGTGATMVFCAAGEAMISHGGEEGRLGRFDTAACEGAGGMTLSGRAELIVIRIDAAGAAG